jgi:hypothetical protein
MLGDALEFGAAAGAPDVVVALAWVEAPAPRPCTTCPYRRDVPAGIWSREENEKLPLYDLPTWLQPLRLFLCHQHRPDAVRHPVCGGWAGCHDADELLALRLAVGDGTMMLETAYAVRAYVSPVPLFASGAEAARHGLSGHGRLSDAAVTAIAKLRRRRADLR